MGSGRWSSATYAGVTASAIADGSTFAYSGTTRAQAQSQWKSHGDLDPNGVKVRESRDSTEHPNSLAIAVLFDVTGSMRQVPQIMQKELPTLLGNLEDNWKVPDPQVLFGAIGDATCDRVPLQVGQFESDNRMDENLNNIFLEGGGGGQNTESYELALYFMARHTSIDCVEKRGHLGHLFIIGDELAYPIVKSDEVSSVLGSATGTQSNISFADILAEAQTKYEVYYVLPNLTSNYNDPVITKFWKDALGANFLTLAKPEDISELIGSTVATAEAKLSLTAMTAPKKSP